MTTVFGLIDRKIRQAFSDAAMHYDVLTSLHKEIGRELIRRVALSRESPWIADIGMGTGWLTNRLTVLFPDARVVGLDFAGGMIDAARSQWEGFHIVEAHAGRLPFRKDTFDAVVSNLAYQWVGDLPAAFQQCREILKKEGTLNITMFGYNTFEELFASFEQSRGASGRPLPLRRLADEKGVAESLRGAGFRDVCVEREKIRTHFPDMMALMKWIQSIGANNLLADDVYIGKNWLQKAGEYYNDTFHDRWGVRATFEVIWVEAKK